MEQKMSDIVDNMKKALEALSSMLLFVKSDARNLSTLLNEGMRILIVVLMRGRKHKG